MAGMSVNTVLPMRDKFVDRQQHSFKALVLPVGSVPTTTRSSAPVTSAVTDKMAREETFSNVFTFMANGRPHIDVRTDGK